MRFSIRDLLLVTVIVALVLGWWEDRRRLSQRIYGLEESVHNLEEYVLLENVRAWSARNKLNAKARLPNSSALAPNPPKP